MNNKLLLDLFQAYYDARKNKRSTINALAFELNFEREIFSLHKEIINRTYQLGSSICFMVFDPVQREIFASSFRDRVIHHLIYNYINPLCENRFIKDSYACRKNKGTSSGVARVEHFIRSCSRNYSRDCYILKVDIKSYFMSIDHKILYGQLERIICGTKRVMFDRGLVLWLIRKIIFHDYTSDCHIKGSRDNWRGLPKSKSLFYVPRNKGLPIGNLTSQLFGNVYLNEFDHFMKNKLGCRYYGRYVDDIVIVHNDRNYIISLVSLMKNFLKDKLLLDLHPKKIYLQHYTKGVDFLGAIIKPYRTYIRNRVKGAFYRRLILSSNLLPPFGCLSKLNLLYSVSMINSYLGILKRRRTYRLRKKIIQTAPKNLWCYLSISADYSNVRLKENEKTSTTVEFFLPPPHVCKLLSKEGERKYWQDVLISFF